MSGRKGSTRPPFGLKDSKGEENLKRTGGLRRLCICPGEKRDYEECVRCGLEEGFVFSLRAAPG